MGGSSSSGSSSTSCSTANDPPPSTPCERCLRKEGDKRCRDCKRRVCGEQCWEPNAKRCWDCLGETSDGRPRGQRGLAKQDGRWRVVQLESPTAGVAHATTTGESNLRSGQGLGDALAGTSHDGGDESGSAAPAMALQRSVEASPVERHQRPSKSARSSLVEACRGWADRASPELVKAGSAEPRRSSSRLPRSIPAGARRGWVD